ncbi:MAG: flagellar basal body rod protein FlgB [Burkholderiaceae bacterium]|nr:flagellar basal body rod protein FlgB [Burkholderiaceae bacterium]
MQRLTQSLDFQAQALNLRSERQRLLAGNIANADTPGYVALEMDFERALREATGTDTPTGLDPNSGLARLSRLAGSQRLDGDNPLVYARNAQDSVDQNTVDLDRERASLADNTVRYEATLRFINGSVRSMLDAMKSASQG